MDSRGVQPGDHGRIVVGVLFLCLVCAAAAREPQPAGLSVLAKSPAREAIRAADFRFQNRTAPNQPELQGKLGASFTRLDLRSCQWSASLGASAFHLPDRLEIRVRSLPRPARRQITCWVRLSSSTPEIVEGINHGAVTEEGWTFSLAKPGLPLDRLYQGSQEGLFRFPLPAGPPGRRVGIVIGIPGDNPGYVRFPELKLEPASRAIPAAPRLVAPDSSDLPTPAAADFFWTASSAAITGAYQLEWQRHGGKTETMRLAANFLTDAMRASPPRVLPPGNYRWRVRAFNLLDEPGAWPAWIRFTVRAGSPVLPSDIAPSAANPFFLIDLETSDPRPIWTRIPPDIQPHMLLRIGGSIATVEQTLEVARPNHIPIALQVNGPHDIITGRWDRLPLTRLLDWARAFPNLKAFYICEQAVQGGIGNAEVRDYMRRLITIGSETGRPVIWADANWGRNVWLDVVADGSFSGFLRRHRGYLLPVWKMNGGFVPYLAPAGLLGLWLSGTVSEWGVQPESWYWVEAGFGKLGVQGGYKEGTRTDAPPMIFEQLALLGTSAGAALYSFEPGNDLLSDGLGDPHAFDGVFVPIARLLLDRTIPAETQVRDAVRKWRRLQSPDLDFRKSYDPALRSLFARTLGIEYPFEEVPASGSCYWIPFFGKKTAAPRELLSRKARQCPAPAAGRAATFRVGRLILVFNSLVNSRSEQRFRITLAGGAVTGTLGPNGWVVAKRVGNDAARLWFSARQKAAIRFHFRQGVFWKRIGGETRNWSSQPVRHLNFVAGPAPNQIGIRR